MMTAATAFDLDAIRSTAAGLKAWIGSGACQSLTGAFVAWVDFVSGRFAYDYAEITGYALTYLAHQGTLTAELNVGHGAASWLAERVRRGVYAAREGWDNEAIYLFDLGMIATGLYSFGRRTQTRRYIDAGQRLVDFLAAEVCSGSISPLARQSPASGRDNWSTHGVVHLTKLVQPFLLARRQEPAATLVESTMSMQFSDGRMPTDPNDAGTMLHPHLYAAEGLWMWGVAQGDEDALERSRAAVDWAWSHQLESGCLPRSVTDGQPDGVEQCDLTAQAVRLALLLGSRPPGLDRAIARLVEVAQQVKGKLALPYQPASGELHLNTWASMFGAQALSLASPGAPRLAWHQLV